MSTRSSRDTSPADTSPAAMTPADGAPGGRGAAAAAEQPARNAARERSPLRAVALPAEHGGWGLTLEPGLLGLLVAPGVAGLLLALAAMVAFVLRTPLKLVAVDLRRRRVLPRTRLAAGVVVAEAVVLATLVAAAARRAEPGWWVPALLAVPLLAVEAWFDARSRSRRLAPELAGAVGVASVAAMVVLAGGGAAVVAAGAWLVLAARSLTCIPHVRDQVVRLHGRSTDGRAAALGDVVALATAALAVALTPALAAGAVGVVGIVGLQRVLDTRPLPRVAVIGVRQMLMGFALVALTAAGIALS